RTGRCCCSCARPRTWRRWRLRRPCRRPEHGQRARRAWPRLIEPERSRRPRAVAATTATPKWGCPCARRAAAGPEQDAALAAVRDPPAAATAHEGHHLRPRRPHATCGRAALRRSVLAAARGLERGQLGGACLALVLRLPLRERLAVDGFAGLVPVHLKAARLRRLAIPVGQTVAAEAGEDHQVDVLHVRALLQQVFTQATEDRRFDLDGVVVGVVHGGSLAARGGDVRQYALPFPASKTA